ncbi:MAG TPA: tetratricopeptide repeat protein [Candidatus Acidoferrum sp.]|nr:tetratricopeptide repeat protein [Candidatus Acidoferrum sp.]
MTSRRAAEPGPTGSPPYLRRAQALSLAVAFCALAGAFLLAQAIDRRVVPGGAAPAAMFFPRAEILRPALLGFDGLAADLFWLRTVQYFGGRVELRQGFPQLYQLADLTTSLDAHFLDAYTYGGLFLVIARQLPQAIALYEKGIAANPTTWQIPHDLGRLYFLELRDYEKALYWWQIADRLPGRPHYLPRFLIRLQAKTGHIETALELWERMLEESENEQVRMIARREIEKLLKELGQERTAAGRT